MLKENKLKENCIRIRIWVKIRGLYSGFPIGLDPYPGQLHPDSQPRLSSFGEYISSSDSSSDLALTLSHLLALYFAPNLALDQTLGLNSDLALNLILAHFWPQFSSDFVSFFGSKFLCQSGFSFESGFGSLLTSTLLCLLIHL